MDLVVGNQNEEEIPGSNGYILTNYRGEYLSALGFQQMGEYLSALGFQQMGA